MKKYLEICWIKLEISWNFVSPEKLEPWVRYSKLLFENKKVETHTFLGNALFLMNCRYDMNVIFVNSRGDLMIPTGRDPGTKQDQDDLWEFIQHTRPDLYKNKREFLNVVRGR